MLDAIPLELQLTKAFVPDHGLFVFFGAFTGFVIIGCLASSRFRKVAVMGFIIDDQDAFAFHVLAHHTGKDYGEFLLVGLLNHLTIFIDHLAIHRAGFFA